MLWTVLTFLTVVSGGWYLAKVSLQAEADWRALTAFSVLMASGWCFAWGFFGFQLSLGLCLFAVACGYRLRERRSALSTSVCWLAYIALIVACYLAHLGGFLALCVILGAAAVARVIQCRERLVSEAAALAPAVLLGAWYVYSRASSVLGVPEEIVLRPPRLKLLALTSPWLRFPLRWDWPVLLGLGVAIVLLFVAAAAAFRSRTRDVLVNYLFFPVVALAGAYLVLPQAQGQAWDVDVRMSPFLEYFLLLWLLSIARSARSSSGSASGFLQPERVLFGTCWVSLLVLLIQIWPYNLEAHKYWEALKRIPEHQVVLTVSTHPYLGRLLLLHHEGNFLCRLSRRSGSRRFQFGERRISILRSAGTVRPAPESLVCPKPSYTQVGEPSFDIRLFGGFKAVRFCAACPYVTASVYRKRRSCRLQTEGD